MIRARSGTLRSGPPPSRQMTPRHGAIAVCNAPAVQRMAAESASLAGAAAALDRLEGAALMVSAFWRETPWKR